MENKNYFQDTSGFSNIPPPPPPPSQTDYTQSSYPQYTPPGQKKSKTGLFIGCGIIAFVLIIGILIGGYFIYKAAKEKKEEIVETIKDVDKEIKKDKEKYKSSDEKTYKTEGTLNGKLYFCEDYRNSKEIGKSDRFTTGWLTVMVDLRDAGEVIGSRDVSIRISKIKDADGYSIKEKFIKKVPFSVDPSFDYIYFQDKKNLKFDTPGTYKVSLLDDDNNILLSNNIEIIPR